MLKLMLLGSRAVLLRPSVATFEEHERNHPGWALLYVAIGATITALLGWLAYVIQAPFLERQFAVLAAEFAAFERRIGQDLPLEEFFVPTDPGFPTLSNIIGTLIGFLTYSGIVFLLGRALGGSGRFGELTYDIALFWTPVSIISALVNVFSIGFFSCLTAPLAIFVALYGLYLTFLSVQSGMNLPPARALILICIPALFFILFFCGLVVLVFSFSN